jgi:hypothetical protein
MRNFCFELSGKEIEEQTRRFKYKVSKGSKFNFGFYLLSLQPLSEVGNGTPCQVDTTITLNGKDIDIIVVSNSVEE